ESKSQMDVKVASRGGTERIAWNRWVQAEGHLQAHAHEHAALMIYGSPIDSSQKVAGFMDILSTLNTSEPTYKQVIDAGGTGSDNCSILKVHWGAQSVFGIYEKGSQYGLKRTDHGVQKIQGVTDTGAAGEFWGYEEQFETDHGLVVKDYRQTVRIANIDVSDLVAGNGADLIDLMISGDYCIDSKENGQGVWYVNRTIEAHLHKQALTKVGAGAGLTFANYQGEQVLMFLGCPVRRSDSMLNSESRVTTATISPVL
ncbi:MAG: major capsid protein, partial [Afipia sp.]